MPQLYSALLEGLCYEMQYNLEKLGEGNVALSRLYACGGGARSSVWLQIKADVWGREIVPVRTEESGSSLQLPFSALLPSQVRRKSCKLAQRFTQHGDPILPDPRHHAYYQKQYETYKKLREFSMTLYPQ